MLPTLTQLAGRPVVVGSGAAGLMAALQLAPLPCVLISAGPLGASGSSALAQGGLAAAVGRDDDIGLHLADTLAAGDGLCDPVAAARIIAAAPDAVHALIRLGARFDRNPDAARVAMRDADGWTEGLALGLEAAHSRRRILHARGDGSGAEVVRALVAAVREAPHITVLEGVTATALLTRHGEAAGLALRTPTGPAVLATRQIVLATGGLGGLYEMTTNPRSSVGVGVALAARAGAAVIDMEFVQFHPTALAVADAGGDGPAPLVSEAVRGEGAILVNDLGVRFMAGVPGGELAPRDVVARAIWRERRMGRQTFLDARACLGARFAARFPAIAAMCAGAGLDPAQDLLPVAPAAHYHMGGVMTDARGRASIPGLWACGEVACTGLHGANRLASNSLIEALVCGSLAADDIRQQPTPAPLRPEPPPPRAAAQATAPGDDAPELAAVRAVMSRHVGLARDAKGLNAAIDALTPIARDAANRASEAALVGLLIAHAALARAESRGGQFRSDAPTRAGRAERRPFMLADPMRCELLPLAARPVVSLPEPPGPRPIASGACPVAPAILHQKIA